MNAMRGGSRGAAVPGMRTMQTGSGVASYSTGKTGAISSSPAIVIPALARTASTDTPAVQQTYSAQDPRRSVIEGLMAGGSGGLSDDNVKYLFYAGAAFVVYYVFLRR